MLIAISIFTLGALGAPLPLDEQPLLFMGQWSHHIPVELPPAPRAMVPEVGISLSPSTQNGPIGMGWALDGVHRIERRGATGGVPAFDGSDAFWLDGQRLYWVSGPGQARYRLEHDDNRIFYHLENSSGGYWTAQRDGDTAWYGSRVR